MVRCCPICGKKPRLKIELFGNQWGAEIVCKTFLRKAHLSTFALNESRVDSVYDAIKMWNVMAMLEEMSEKNDGH